MKSDTSFVSSLNPIVQLCHNSNAWIGHLREETVERRAGQTFECPADGYLDHIELFAASVPQEGKLFVSFHVYDPQTHRWGPVLGAAETTVHPDDRENWIAFEFPRLRLEKNHGYGFRIQSQGALVAIGETALSGREILSSSREWNSDGIRPEGRFYRYFSLAYKVAMRGRVKD